MRWLRKGRHEIEPSHPVYADSKVAGITWSVRSKLLVGIAVGLLCLLTFAFLDAQAEADARHRDVKKLACLLVEHTKPGADSQADQIRKIYGCTGYTPRPTAPAATVTTTTTAEAPHALTSPSLPGVTPRPSVSASKSTPHPAATVSARSTAIPVNPLPSTVTSTATRTITSAPTLPAGPTCILGPLLCGVLGG